jgi:hypothetical protein
MGLVCGNGGNGGIIANSVDRHAIGGNGGNGDSANNFCGTNGGTGGMALFGGTANGESGNNNGNGGDGGLAIGQGSVANGENGHEGGLAVGFGSNANGGGTALEGGDTEGGRFFADNGSTHPGCNIAIDHDCFNQPGR